MPFAPVRAKHAARGRSLAKAIGGVSRDVQVHVKIPGFDWEDVDDNDLCIARFAKILVSPLPIFDRHGCLQNKPKLLLDEYHRRASGGPGGATNWFINECQQSILELADGQRVAGLVHAIVTPSGREIYQHNITMRISQRSMAMVLQPNVEHLLGRYSVYAYRTNRSHFTALHHARCYQRRGLHYMAKADIRDFFSSITEDLVAEAILERCSFIRPDALKYILGTMSPRIYRGLYHPGVRSGQYGQIESPLYCILQGSTLGPMISNIVGFHLLDRPFAEAMQGKAVLLRYADDMLIVSADEGAVREGLALLRDLAAPLVLHTDECKTSPAPVDTRTESVRWLGKDICRGEVTTPEEKISTIRQWLEDNSDTDDLNSIMRSSLVDLLLDPVATLDDFIIVVCGLSSTHERLCAESMDWWDAFRKKMFAGSARLLKQQCCPVTMR